MIKITKLICVLIVTLTLGGCWNGPYEDTASMYLQRSDTITLSAGNAKDVNAVTHIIDPWPRGGGNRRFERTVSGWSAPSSDTSLALPRKPEVNRGRAILAQYRNPAFHRRRGPPPPL